MEERQSMHLVRRHICEGGDDLVHTDLRQAKIVFIANAEHASAARHILAEDTVPFTERIPFANRVARAEQGDARRADESREMHGAGIVADERVAPIQYCRRAEHAEAATKIERASAPGFA